MNPDSAATPLAAATAPNVDAKEQDPCNRLSAGLRHARRMAMLFALLAPGAGVAADQELDDAAALSLAKKSNCLKCHSIERRKNAPSYKDVAAKYKGVAGAEQKLFRHLTESQTVKADEGDEAHPTLGTKSEGEIANVVRWILSR